MNANELMKQLQVLNDLVIELVAQKKSLEKENEFLKQLLMKPTNEQNNN